MQRPSRSASLCAGTRTPRRSRSAERVAGRGGRSAANERTSSTPTGAATLAPAAPNSRSTPRDGPAARALITGDDTRFSLDENLQRLKFLATVDREFLA